MNQIPVEVLELIFDRLPIGHLEVCRMVCKKWCFVIDCQMRFDCLVIYQTLRPVNQTFFQTNRKVSLRHCISLDDFNDPSKFKKNIYRKFKRIYIYNGFHADRLTGRSLFNSCIARCPRMVIDIAMLNYLSHLEELNLGWMTINPSCKLSLPKLKTFKTDKFLGGSLILDALQLTNLSLSSLYHFELLHPETIETLEIRGILASKVFSRFDCVRKFLMILSGLKYLLIEVDSYGLAIDPELTQRMAMIEFFRERLMEIHFLGIPKPSRELDQMMRELKEQALEKKIFFNGLEMECLRDIPNQPTQIALLTKNERDFHLSAFFSPETLLLYTVNYNLIEPLIRSGSNFFKPRNLPRLEMVNVNEQVKDELKFSRWLQRSNTLLEIIFRCPFSPDFYSNQMPACCPTIQCLQFIFDAPLDFSFLLKLKFLYKIEFSRSDCNHNYDLVEFLFSDLTYLTILGFYELRGETSKVALRVLKREKEKIITYELYDNQLHDNLNVFKRFIPVKIFESFESLVKFTNEFT